MIPRSEGPGLAFDDRPLRQLVAPRTAGKSGGKRPFAANAKTVGPRKRIKPSGRLGLELRALGPISWDELFA